MPRPPLYEWDGMEYTFDEKGGDWYWALGIIAVAGTIASVLFGNIILAFVILAASGTLALQTLRPPQMRHFSITEAGIVVDGRLHPYEEMLSFSVLEYADETIPPSLSIKTKKLLSPHLVIPIIGHDPVEVYEHFLDILPEGRHDESFFDRIIEMLRL
ncbi:MAG: protein of unknown function with transrane region [Parcubacteria group bacterium]|nr:protein of unknown function with transrane region [Parcubacteria group bacterium]